MLPSGSVNSGPSAPEAMRHVRAAAHSRGLAQAGTWWVMQLAQSVVVESESGGIGGEIADVGGVQLRGGGRGEDGRGEFGCQMGVRGGGFVRDSWFWHTFPEPIEVNEATQP